MQAKSYRKLLVALFLVFLLFSSGCALFWLGAGGAGGYMIRKGEEGGSSKRGQSTGAEDRPSSREY